MKIRILALALVLTFAGTAAQAEVKPYIVGGEFVTNAPWAVQLQNGGSFGCTGSIIAPEWVLTARHCWGDSVRVGDIDLGQGAYRAIIEHVEHPAADLRLMRLESEVDTEYVRLADQAPEVGSTHHIYGWGTTDYECCDSISPILKRAAVTVIGTSRDAYGGVAVETRWATGTAGYGDSGGPQLDGYGVQVGVCSTGDYVRTQYASVAHHRDWIRSVAGV
ncbi:trypsin-like serine protease [Lentzea sp. BCCO 10_0856]|uniref:Trypsin-like serine protease n=1 Tax=Lentzea miocenica TaxID=3095431 RepID=A0ABU4TDX4_9PSEU|nr:trypsin-like serine protease [Lentzea sp. BCCO 10_0856]MDX8036392.1 trypsin-like serine protease [Lentzea sp. BCCO 10_0856]